MSLMPLTPHWADQTAVKVIAKKGDKASFVVASGITPSGTVHIGNFREVITVDLVARALKLRGKEVRFIYSWDDFDTFRKVPKNFPQQEMLATHLRQPISRVPDPWGKTESYAMANIQRFQNELSPMGIKPEFLYQHRRYSSGEYAEPIRHALENRDKIRGILDRFRTEPLETTWLPTAIYCESCDRDEMAAERYGGEWNYYYKCGLCGHEATTDIRTTKNLKLNWRTDWPMRWGFEGVDFEPGGKDHSSDGGSFDTGAVILQEIWGKEPPVYLQYDFVSIKGGTGKMSSSKGELFTLSDALEVYDPQMVRWLFANQRPNHDFSLAFDADVIKFYDEFDRAETQIFADKGEPSTKLALLRRTYELSLPDGKMPDVKPVRAGFRVLCNRLQGCDGNVQRTYEQFYTDEIFSDDDRRRFEERATRALTWLEKHAPEEFRYSIRTQRHSMPLNDLETMALKALWQMVDDGTIAALAPTELNQAIYDRAIHGSGAEPMAFFRVVYQKLIGRDQGPRLPGFLKEIGRERLLELLGAEF